MSPSFSIPPVADRLNKLPPYLFVQIDAMKEALIKEGRDVIGIHSVLFDLNSEKITLTHEATDRQVFAQGALVVARHFLELWNQPGFYGMDDFVSAIEKVKRR